MSGIDWLYVALLNFGICAAMLMCVAALAVRVSGKLMRGMLAPKKPKGKVHRTTSSATSFFPTDDGRIVDSVGNELKVPHGTA